MYGSDSQFWPINGQGIGINTNHSTTNQIRPPLYHFPVLVQVFGAVVGGAHFVALGMRQLALDHVRVKAFFVQRCRGLTCRNRAVWLFPGRPCGPWHSSRCFRSSACYGLSSPETVARRGRSMAATLQARPAPGGIAAPYVAGASSCARSGCAILPTPDQTRPSARRAVRLGEQSCINMHMAIHGATYKLYSIYLLLNTTPICHQNNPLFSVSPIVVTQRIRQPDSICVALQSMMRKKTP